MFADKTGAYPRGHQDDTQNDITYNDFTYNANTCILNMGDIAYKDNGYNINKCSITFMFVSTFVSQVIYK